MKRIAVLLLLASVAVIISCTATPGPVYRLQTVSGDHEKVWLHGREYNKLEGKNVDFIVAFDKIEDYTVGYIVEIINHGPGPLLVSSELFSGYYMDKEQKYDEFFRMTAIDPEKKLIEAEFALSREKSRYAQESGMKGLGGLFELAADIATIGDQKTDEELEREAEEDAADELRDIKDERRHIRNIDEISNGRGKWEFSALRKTTVPPGHSISGKIYFSLRKSKYFFKIIYDEENENLSTIFQINKYTSK